MSREKLDAAWALVPFEFRELAENKFNTKGRAGIVKLWETGLGIAWQHGYGWGKKEGERGWHIGFEHDDIHNYGDCGGSHRNGCGRA